MRVELVAMAPSGEVYVTRVYDDRSGSATLYLHRPRPDGAVPITEEELDLAVLDVGMAVVGEAFDGWVDLERGRQALIPRAELPPVVRNVREVRRQLPAMRRHAVDTGHTESVLDLAMSLLELADVRADEELVAQVLAVVRTARQVSRPSGPHPVSSEPGSDIAAARERWSDTSGILAPAA